MTMNPTHCPVVKIVIQRGKGDCGICALAMFLDKSYEDVFAAAVARTKSRRLHHSGMYWRQIRETAAGFGVALVNLRKFDCEADCGIVAIRMDKTNDHYFGHVALLKAGLIFDTDGTVWEPDAYWLAHDAEPTALYTTGRTA